MVSVWAAHVSIICTRLGRQEQFKYHMMNNVSHVMCTLTTVMASLLCLRSGDKYYPNTVLSAALCRTAVQIVMVSPQQ